jgi:FAD/FMN-containing dehydrogenase
MDYQLESDLRRQYHDRLTWQKSIPTFHPEIPAEAGDVFRRARAGRQRLYLAGFGNNIDPVGERFAELLVLKSDRLNKIVEIAPPDYYIIVGAGYPLKEINQVIDGHGLWFPFGDTNYPGSCGGAVAAGLTANDGCHTVPLSRFLLSVTAVLADGEIVTPGAVTFKSVSGYDMSRLFYNSWGLVGMIMTLAFRVLPISKKSGFPYLALDAIDRSTFLDRFKADNPMGELCRKIKREYDPTELLPIV